MLNLEKTDAQLNGEVVHRVLIANRDPILFLGVEWYDKPMSYRECLEKLRELKSLAATIELTIVSFGVTYSITSPLEFCRWVKAVFEGDLADGFSSRLCGDCLG